MTSSASNRRRRVAGERRRDGSGAGGPGIPAPPVLPPTGRVSDPEDPEEYAEDLADGEPDAATGAATDGEDPTEQAPEGGSTRLRRPVLVAALAAGLALLLALAAGAATLVGRQQEDRASGERTAVNSARTSLEQLLSYNYETLDKQTADVTALLTGSFKDDYGKTVASDIKPLAVKNKTVVQARVSEAGVMDTTGVGEGDRVTVMAFVDQARASAELDQPTIDQNRVIVTMTRVGDRWLISGLKAF